MLWRWAWVAALVTGAVVWGLIFYAIWRFRRRSDDEVPVQTRYNLPLEIFYTIAPIVMVVVFFFHTERTQNIILRARPDPDHTVYVVGQQWTWTFNYLPGYPVPTPDDKVVYTVGEAGAATDARAARRQDRHLQAALARRDPRLRGARLPDEDGRHPRARRTTTSSR